jgi:uncharacterized membrane protein
MPKWLNLVGRVFYSAGLIGIGIQHFIFADFISVILPGWPAWIPGRSVWAYAAGAALVAAGISMLSGFHARTVGAITGMAFLLLVLLVDILTQLRIWSGNGLTWADTFTAFSLSGGAWVFALTFKDLSFRVPRPLERLMPFGRFFLPITMVVFGVEHFLYTSFVATLVPGWIPGHVFWTYFAGAALIAAGLALIVNVQARLAALLSGIMFFLWVVLLNLPRAFADPSSGNGGEWTSVFEALASSGIAFMLASGSLLDRRQESVRRVA